MRCCLSSLLFSCSLSESEPSLNVSSRVLSASEVKGSSESRCRDTGDEARDRKDGGGDEGIE